MDEFPDEERVQRALAELGATPLPPAVEARLDARLAAELTSSPLTERRAHRHRVRIGGGLAGAAAVAAAIVFALSTGGGGPSNNDGQSALRDNAAASVAADAAKPESTKAMKIQAAPAAKKGCASRTAGDRPRPGCPGARGGHARAV